MAHRSNVPKISHDLIEICSIFGESWEFLADVKFYEKWRINLVVFTKSLFRVRNPVAIRRIDDVNDGVGLCIILRISLNTNRNGFQDEFLANLPPAVIVGKIFDTSWKKFGCQARQIAYCGEDDDSQGSFAIKQLRGNGNDYFVPQRLKFLLSSEIPKV